MSDEQVAPLTAAEARAIAERVLVSDDPHAAYVAAALKQYASRVTHPRPRGRGSYG